MLTFGWLVLLTLYGSALFPKGRDPKIEPRRLSSPPPSWHAAIAFFCLMALGVWSSPQRA